MFFLEPLILEQKSLDEFPRSHDLSALDRHIIRRFVFSVCIDRSFLNFHVPRACIGIDHSLIWNFRRHMPRHEKTNNVVFEQARRESSCTSIEDGKILKIFDLQSSGIVLSV